MAQSRTGRCLRIEYAPELEKLGYQTIWVGIGADPVGGMELLEQMIAATKHAIIASAIINMWQDDARSIARHYHRIVDRHYVDALLDGRVPAEAIVIGALGTKTLTLAGDKTLGAPATMRPAEQFDSGATTSA